MPRSAAHWNSVDRLRGIPERHHRERDEASGVGLHVVLDLDLVAGAQGLEAELLGHLGMVQRLDVADVRIERVRVDAVRVHRLHPLGRDVRALRNVGPARDDAAVGRHSLHEGESGEGADPLAEHVPGVGAVAGVPDLRDLVAPLGRTCATCSRRRPPSGDRPSRWRDMASWCVSPYSRCALQVPHPARLPSGTGCDPDRVLRVADPAVGRRHRRHCGQRRGAAVAARVQRPPPQRDGAAKLLSRPSQSSARSTWRRSLPVGSRGSSSRTIRRRGR